MASKTHALDASAVHYRWDSSLTPRLTIEPGDTVVFETRDAGDLEIKPGVSHDFLVSRQFRGHPLTGPVAVRGAEPGDGLAIEVVEVKPGPYGWTGIYPGRGLVGSDFDRPYIQIWDLSNSDTAELKPGVIVPLAPFCGVMGVALDEDGEHSTGPPRRWGGNLDIRQLTAGSTLYLPIARHGALFSTGDTHGVQGDGEVCLTAIEMPATVTLKFDLIKNAGWEGPRLRTKGRIESPAGEAGYFATIGIGPDLFAGSQQAIRAMIDYLVRERGLTREEAYVLCSVVVDLRISEIVDAPNWVVSAFLPLGVFLD